MWLVKQIFTRTSPHTNITTKHHILLLVYNDNKSMEIICIDSYNIHTFKWIEKIHNKICTKVIYVTVWCTLNFYFQKTDSSVSHKSMKYNQISLLMSITFIFMTFPCILHLEMLMYSFINALQYQRNDYLWIWNALSSSLPYTKVCLSVSDSLSNFDLKITQ